MEHKLVSVYYIAKKKAMFKLTSLMSIKKKKSKNVPFQRHQDKLTNIPYIIDANFQYERIIKIY